MSHCDNNIQTSESSLENVPKSTTNICHIVTYIVISATRFFVDSTNVDSFMNVGQYYYSPSRADRSDLTVEAKINHYIYSIHNSNYIRGKMSAEHYIRLRLTVQVRTYRRARVRRIYYLVTRLLVASLS